MSALRPLSPRQPVSGTRADLPAVTIGLDVGSTTVKAVVMDPRTDEILWKDYERHETRQPEKVLAFLERIEEAFPVPVENVRVFTTGSGADALAEFTGAKFVQEVNAVSLAVEHLFPEAGSVIELGGQDAKIIIWLTDPESGARRKIASMNDKCAGGTGAVIDKISAKLNLTESELRESPYVGVDLHPVAGKCGVFAETDINGLQKQGIPPEQLMASLYEAIVQQNLSVLTRGNTLRPTVLLLGGPNTFIPGLRDCWKRNIPEIWKERNVPLPEGMDPGDLVQVPENAEYYAAIGSVLYGKGEEPGVGCYKGTGELRRFLDVGRARLRDASGDGGLSASREELEAFREAFKPEPFDPPAFTAGETVSAFIGLDGGSTSTKGVLMDRSGEVLATAYQLSRGNPLADAQEILAALREQVERQGAGLRVLGVGTTGYAKDMLAEALSADVGIVETVAHTKSALHYYRDVDVIVDVGGQDIKVIALTEGRVKDFRLNTQCSAGNGYFLQNTAARFGYTVDEYADIAFEAERAPVFNYGCAVFMETDIVNFQRLGWEKKEIMAGLARVLPRNIWLYVVAEPNLARFGTRFVLQGGTQHNLAAVKAQHDFIKSKVPGASIRVHRFTGESGAIGAALEAMRVVGDGETTFIGLDQATALHFTATRDESTRCGRCRNDCIRTFVDIRGSGDEGRRYIIAPCERGEAEGEENVKAAARRLAAVQRENPNFFERGAVEPFRSFRPEPVTSLRAPENGHAERAAGPLFPFLRLNGHARPAAAPAETRARRASIRIGMPRVLAMYTLAPLFRSYFEALGVDLRHIVYSAYTDANMWFKGSRRGSIDQCFPSKAAVAHVHSLIFEQKPDRKPDIIFFPVVRAFQGELVGAVDSAACPGTSITPEVVRAAFTKEGDLFAENGIQYLSPSLDLRDWDLVVARMHQCFKGVLGVTEAENREALEIARREWDGYFAAARAKGREALDRIEREGRVGVVMLARPYHSDPGLSHEIATDIQRKGYPVFSIDSLPRDAETLERLFGEEVRAGIITDPMDVTDVWKNAYSENSSKKIWAAKYVARHPNLVAVDLSSFKCGHDAPIYDTVERIVEATGTPYFTFHDLDENRPTAAIKIRVETIDYFLRRHQEALRRETAAAGDAGRLPLKAAAPTPASVATPPVDGLATVAAVNGHGMLASPEARWELPGHDAAGENGNGAAGSHSNGSMQVASRSNGNGHGPRAEPGSSGPHRGLATLAGSTRRLLVTPLLRRRKGRVGNGRGQAGT